MQWHGKIAGVNVESCREGRGAFQEEWRYKDWGRDLALYLGRQQCGIRLAELGALTGGIDYVKVSNRLRRFEAASREDPTLKRVVKQALTILEKGKM